MITETMVLVALRQKNWIQAETMSREIILQKPSEIMEVVSSVSKIAGTRPEAAYLLSLWAGIRWKEINEDEDFT